MNPNDWIDLGKRVAHKGLNLGVEVLGEITHELDKLSQDLAPDSATSDSSAATPEPEQRE